MKVDDNPVVSDLSLVHMVETNVVAKLVEDGGGMHAAVGSQVVCVSTHVLVVSNMGIASVALVLE